MKISTIYKNTNLTKNNNKHKLKYFDCKERFSSYSCFHILHELDEPEKQDHLNNYKYANWIKKDDE